MLGIRSSSWLFCTRRLRARHQASSLRLSYPSRNASGPALPPTKDDDSHGEDNPKGAMSRRLEQMSEENIESGGRAAQKAVEEAGFSEELKARLERKFADSQFQSDHAGLLAQANMSHSAPKHARDIAGALPWSGNEAVADASLRMLNDAHKPLRVAPRASGPRGPPRQIDTGRLRGQPGSGARLASAKEKASVYSLSVEEQKGMSDQERDSFRREMKARFMPGARNVAASVQGLNSLASQRIEDAIARGQFKNLPNRGKKLERDHNADSPFINTTEYFMNKMIKKQEIVPPWIEKQQEVISTANTFRQRLRNDWKRHICRMIGSRGGDLASKLQLAEEYAFAERLENPSKQQMEKMNAVDDHGHMSQITISGELKSVSSDDATRFEEEIEVLEQTLNDDGSLKPAEEQVKVITEHSSLSQQPAPAPPEKPKVPPFRDLQWEQMERSYHNLAIQQLNSLTRSYNLMAPDLAKKPYFSLERELKSCFADVAPQVPAAIRDRALTPKVKGVEVIGHKAGSVLEKFSMDKASHVYDERKPSYGFKEFWRDLFASKT